MSTMSTKSGETKAKESPELHEGTSLAEVYDEERIRELHELLPKNVALGAPQEFLGVNGRVLDGLLKQKLAPTDVVPTPLHRWNLVCGGDGEKEGLARGWVAIVGGATGQGKSLVLANCVVSALRAGRTVVLVSLEMGLPLTLTRILSIASGVPVWKLEKGKTFCTRSYREAAGRLLTLPGTLVVNRLPVSRLDLLTEMMDVMVHHAGADLFVWDYLQLVRAEDQESLAREVSRVSRTIRECTERLRTRSLAASQLNRETSKNRGEAPQPTGLIGSSQLENDSTQILLLNHANYRRHKDNLGADTELLVAKNRVGPGETIPIRWDYRTLTMSERES